MRKSLDVSGLLALGLALLLPLYLWSIWPQVPAQVPQHYTNGVADSFMARQYLVELSCVPALLYSLCTCMPEVHAAGFGWWRSARQRQLRAVVVAAASVVLLTGIYRVTA